MHSSMLNTTTLLATRCVDDLRTPVLQDPEQAVAASDHDLAYLAMWAAGHTTMALHHGLHVHRITPQPNVLGAASFQHHEVLLGIYGDPTKRLEAWVAGPIATELLCGIVDDDEHTCTGAFQDALEEAWRTGTVTVANFADDFDASVHWATHCWVPALERVRTILRTGGLRRAAFAIAARLLQRREQTIEHAELMSLFFDAIGHGDAATAD